jgi:hypothetical protein
MKELTGILLALGLLGGASALAVQAGDRQTVVSPPDAVAEELVRALVNQRFDPARAYLADPDGVTEAQLRSLAEALGDPTTIEAELVRASSSRALAIVRTSTAEHSDAHTFALVFDRDWKVDLGIR